MLLLPSSDIVEPPHNLSDRVSCDNVVTSALVVDEDDVTGSPTAPSVNVVTFRLPVDESVVRGFVPLLPSPSSVMSDSLNNLEYVPPEPAVQKFSDASQNILASSVSGVSTINPASTSPPLEFTFINVSVCSDMLDEV